MMAKQNYLWVLLFIFFISSKAIAQNEKFAFGITGQMGWSDRWFSEQWYPISSYEREHLRENEKESLAAELGIFVEYYFNDKLSIQSGLRGMRQGYTSEQIFLNSLRNLFDNSNNLGIFYTREENLYLELPIEVNYYFFRKKSALFCTVGFAPNYNFSNKSWSTFIEVDGRRMSQQFDSGELSSYRTFNAGAKIGIGWQKLIAERWSILIQPDFKVQVLNQGKAYDFNRQLLSYGLSFGFKYR